MFSIITLILHRFFSSYYIYSFKELCIRHSSGFGVVLFYFWNIFCLINPAPSPSLKREAGKYDFPNFLAAKE